MRVKDSSDLSIVIKDYAHSVENHEAESSIQDQIYKVLPLGSPESGVLEHIREHFEGEIPKTEKGSPPWDKHDYFYRVEAYRNRVQVWYFVKEQKLVRVKVAHVRAHL